MIIDLELEEKVKNICKRFNISCVFDFVKEKNPSNNLPYHNWYHACCMVEKVIEGANYHNLPYRSMRHLAVAALLHDFAHSGGHRNDAANIQIALAGAYALECIRPDRTVANGIDMSELEELIKVTEYPYVLDPICIEHRIIRDADLMQGLRPTWKEMIIDNLRQEMSIALKKEISEQEMLVGSHKFLSNITPLSNWGYDVMITQEGLSYAIANVTLSINRYEA
jgi:hypothetical protein